MPTLIQAAIFDMDGLLLDSEPFWKAAEREVFAGVGIHISDEMALPTSRMTTAEVTAYWYAHKPWTEPSLADVERKVIDSVGQLIATGGRLLPGVVAALDFFRRRSLKIGLATNAPASLVPQTLDKLGIRAYFDAVAAADEVSKGKPDPDVYLLAAQRLGVAPAACLAFEDSASGMMAALHAGMKVTVVPAPGALTDLAFTRAHLKLECLADFGDACFTALCEAT